VAVLDIAERKGRCYSVPGLQLSEVWMVTKRELLLKGVDGQMVHLDISLRGLDAMLSEVNVLPAPGREAMPSKHVLGVKEDAPALPRDACASVLTEHSYLATLVREVRGAYAQRSQVEHFGKDAFATFLWPRPAAALAEPLMMIPPASPGNPIITAIHLDSSIPEAWCLELLDVQRGTIRRWEPSRAAPQETVEASAVDDQPMKLEARLASVQMLSSRAVVVQSNGWVRIVEVNRDALEEQRKQWQSMMGSLADEEPLTLKVNGEEESLDDTTDEEEPNEEEQANEEDDADDEEDREKALEVGMRELDSSFRGIEEALRSNEQAQAALEKIRAELAATTISTASKEELGKALSGDVGQSLVPDVQALLQKAASDPASLVEEAKRAIEEAAHRPQDHEGAAQQQGQAGRSQLPAREATRSAIAKALTQAITGEPSLENRIEKLAEAAVDFAEQEAAQEAASGGGGANEHLREARLQATRELLEAARNAVAARSGPGKPGSGGESLASSTSTALDEMQNLASAERSLAEALQAGGHAAEGGDEKGDVQRSKGLLGKAANSVLEAAGGLARAAGRAVGRRGRGKGGGRGRGSGRGAGGSGQGSQGSRRGGRSGKGFGQGPQLSSNQKGGYTEAQLRGELTDEDQKAAARVLAKSKEVAKRDAVNRSLREFSSEQYDSALKAVSRQIRELRVVLEQQEAKDREREWVGHQATGELDDSRLVDGVTGEKLIYRKRIEPDVPMGHQMKRPKRLSFVMDVSASMSRFNGEDGRLDRMVQAIVMLMESLEGFDHKYVWNLVGHSGNGSEIIFVDYGNPPRTRQHRAQVISAVTSASAIAASGDSTTEAIATAVQRVAAEEADDYLVFAVSDANLGGYGITPELLRKVLTADPKVSASAIFIAEREAAQMLSTSLPPGRGFVCLDVSQLPNILKEIFARATTSR